MQTFWSASWTGRLAASASEYATTVLMPRSRHDRRIRSAISPRFATRIFLNRFAIGLGVYLGLWVVEPVQEPEPAQGANINLPAGSLQASMQWPDARPTDNAADG